MILIKSICKAIKDYSVLQRSLSHFHPSSHVNDMRCLQEGISKGVRSFISLVHNTARQLKRQTPALWLQVDTPNPGSPPSSLLHLSRPVSPSWPVHFPSSKSPSSKCFLSIDQINRPWGHMATGLPSYQGCSRWFPVALCCQQRSASLPAWEAREPQQKTPPPSWASDHHPRTIPQYSLGLSTLK